MRIIAILLIAALVATAVPAKAQNEIEEAFLITTGSADPERPFEAFDAVSMAAVDLDGDGAKEIVAHNDNNRLYVFSADGELLSELRSRVPEGWPVRELGGPAVGDISGDGKADLVVANSAGHVTVFAQDDEQWVRLWETDVVDDERAGLDGPPFLVDADKDGRHAVHVQLDDAAGLFKLDPTGDVVWHEQLSDGNAGPVAGDLDGDGILEVVYPSDGGGLWVFDARTMEHRCTFNAHEHDASPGSISVSPTLADLTGDGALEAVFGVRNVAEEQEGDWIARSHAHYFAVDAECAVVWQQTFDWGNPHVHMQPVPVDVTGDGALDVLFQDWNTIGHLPGAWEHTGPANLFALEGATGELLWRVETPNLWSNKNLAVADVTGDGEAEILANELQHGDGLGLFTLEGQRSGFVPAPQGWVVSKGPLVDDLTGDGHLEIVLPVHRSADFCERELDVGCREGALAVYSTGSQATPLYSNNHHLSIEPETAFTNVRGNAWWVEADVVSDHPVDAVEARVDGGEWQPLSSTVWGSWARSLQVPEGSVVELRAITGDEETRSHCHAWPEATPSVCART